MIQSAIETLGPWNWWILALILMGLEIVAPGTFFLWFGISAFVIGTITLALGPDTSFWIWQTQVIGFVVMSLVTALFGRRYMMRYSIEDQENANLNRRGLQMIGRTALLKQAIAEGHGRVKFGETTWRVTGPDLPEGTRVRVIDAHGGTLQVEPIVQSDSRNSPSNNQDS
jgi:inner membrane protein